MKKLLFASIIALLTACSEADQGKHNACQYVREQIPQQTDNIKSVEVVGEDSVLSPLMIKFGVSEIYSKHGDFYDNDITIEEWHAYLDSMLSIGLDSQRSWIMNKEWNDSLKQMSKYQGSWRKAYWVEVTMKSGATKQYRVCMNEDGITPSMSFEQFQIELDDFMKALNE